MIKKIIYIVIVVMICLSINGIKYETLAAGTDGQVSTTITPNDYKPESESDANGADRLKDLGNVIIGFLQIVGSVVSVLVLLIIGIKYMIGSAEEKAEYKKSMTPYVLGAVMVFAITNILKIVAGISKALL